MHMFGAEEAKFIYALRMSGNWRTANRGMLPSASNAAPAWTNARSTSRSPTARASRQRSWRGPICRPAGRHGRRRHVQHSGKITRLAVSREMRTAYINSSALQRPAHGRTWHSRFRAGRRTSIKHKCLRNNVLCLALPLPRRKRRGQFFEEPEVAYLLYPAYLTKIKGIAASRDLIHAPTRDPIVDAVGAYRTIFR